MCRRRCVTRRYRLQPDELLRSLTQLVVGEHRTDKLYRNCFASEVGKVVDCGCEMPWLSPLITPVARANMYGFTPARQGLRPGAGVSRQTLVPQGRRRREQRRTSAGSVWSWTSEPGRAECQAHRSGLSHR